MVELAGTLGLPLAWLKAEAAAGRIPSLRVGRRRLFDVEAVRDALRCSAAVEAPQPADGAAAFRGDPVPDAPTAPAPLLVSAAEATRRIGPDEELITLAEAARRLPRIDGKKVSICTIWRWCRRGLRGVHLRYVRVGRKICTSHDSLTQFFTELSALDRQARPQGRPSFLAGRKPVTSKQRLRALREADRILEEAGI